MEALGTASAIISVTQLTGKVISIIYDYQRGARHASKQINAVKRELQQLRDVLERLEDLASDDENQSASFDSIANPLQACQAELQRLETVLTTNKCRLSKVGQALKWPFKGKEVKECLDVLAGQRSILQLSLTADQSTVMLAIRDEVSRSDRRVTNLNDSFKSFTIEESKTKLLEWLKAPDPSTNHNKACQARQPNTGLWLLNGTEYQNWKTDNATLLWLHGIPGCGKTILSSTLIEELALSCRSRPKSLLLYFYFDFNDKEKEEVDWFLRSMLRQIASQQDRVSVSLSGLYERCSNGTKQPVREVLITTLRDSLRDSTETFIVLDALDECTELQPLLSVIAMISEWQVPSLHLVCTSRRERQIVRAFDHSSVVEISIQNEQVDADIGLLVDDELQHDIQLRQWSMEIKEEIKTALKKGSQGMFRWAVCQLEALKSCLKLKTLRQALRTLPRTLDETYERILKGLNEDDLKDALKIFQWLIYAKRPLTLGELAEAVAISADDTPVFDPDDRLRHPIDLLQLCSALVTLQETKNRTSVICVVRVAHYSVQEYLLSNSNIHGSQAPSPFEESIAQDYIAKACLTYLLYVGKVLANKEHFSHGAIREQYVLYTYTAQKWVDHARRTDGIAGSLMRKLFCNETAFIRWTAFHDPTYLLKKFPVAEDAVSLNQTYCNDLPDCSHNSKAIYVASSHGFTSLVESLVSDNENINQVLGRQGTALSAAAYNGHAGVVRTLLKHGAWVIVESPYEIIRANSLDSAFRWGLKDSNPPCDSAECIRLLIHAEKFVNPISEWATRTNVMGMTTLEVAASKGHTEAVKVLIEKGAVNFATISDRLGKGIPYSTALLWAAKKGHPEIVQMLLENGADITFVGTNSLGERTTPLLAAIEDGYSQIAKILIENGADVNFEAEAISDDMTLVLTPLATAAMNGDIEIIEMLLASGADVNVTVSANASEDLQSPIAPLLVAALEGHVGIVKILLASGADVNSKVRAISEGLAITVTPLLSAAEKGHKDIVRILLASGADANVKGEHGDARETALSQGHEDIAALLSSSE